MKKYISASLRVINVNANDIIATSFGAAHAATGYSEEGYEGGYSAERRGWDEF